MLLIQCAATSYKLSIEHFVAIREYHLNLWESCWYDKDRERYHKSELCQILTNTGYLELKKTKSIKLH